MAPMTRNLADVDGVPTTSLVTYYEQRAGAGLIVTEGTKPSATGYGGTDAGYIDYPALDQAA